MAMISGQVIQQKNHLGSLICDMSLIQCKPNNGNYIDFGYAHSKRNMTFLAAILSPNHDLESGHSNPHFLRL